VGDQQPHRVRPTVHGRHSSHARYSACRVMSASAKPRLAGRQPSRPRWGAPGEDLARHIRVRASAGPSRRPGVFGRRPEADVSLPATDLCPTEPAPVVTFGPVEPDAAQPYPADPRPAVTFRPVEPDAAQPYPADPRPAVTFRPVEPDAAQ